MRLFDYLQTGAMFLSLAGAGFSWWYANLSKKAKREAAESRTHAVTAEQQAAQSIEAQRGLVAETKRLAESSESAAKRAVEALEQNRRQIEELRQIAQAIEFRAEQAKASAEEAARIRSHMARLADVAQGPHFKLEKAKPDNPRSVVWFLSNQWPTVATVSEFVNRGDFNDACSFPAVPLVLRHHEIVELQLVSGWGVDNPKNLVVRLDSGEEHVVPIRI